MAPLGQLVLSGQCRPQTLLGQLVRLVRLALSVLCCLFRLSALFDQSDQSHLSDPLNPLVLLALANPLDPCCPSAPFVPSDLVVLLALSDLLALSRLYYPPRPSALFAQLGLSALYHLWGQ